MVQAASEPAVESKPTRGRRILIILHGKRAGDENFDDEVKHLKELGHEVKVRVTYEAGDVDDFVKEALSHDEPPETFVAAGGDGTLNELVAAMIKHNAPEEIAVGLVPYGTANDFAAANGISEDPKEALEIAADAGNIHKIDVGIVNGQVFMNTAGVGAACEVDPEESSSALKRALGPLAILFYAGNKIFANGLEPKHDITIRVPRVTEEATEEELRDLREHGKEPVKEIKGDLLLLIAGNGRQIAKTIAACPDALLDDGLLDITLMRGTAGEQVGEIVSDLFNKGVDQAMGRVEMFRVPWLEVEGPEVMQINRDGEPSADDRKARFEVMKGRINMHLPDNRLLVSGNETGKKPKLNLHRMKPGKIGELFTQVKKAPARALKNPLSKLIG